MAPKGRPSFVLLDEHKRFLSDWKVKGLELTQELFRDFSNRFPSSPSYRTVKRAYDNLFGN